MVTSENQNDAVQVLLVDDDEDDFIITRDLLADVGHVDYELTWVNQAQAAIDKIDAGSFDICLVDYRLGDGTGLDLIGHLGQRDDAPPTILLTGEADRALDIEAMKAGASDFLVKGQVTPPMLEKAVRYAIDRQRSERELARLAQYDPLTGLLNRNAFKRRLDEAVGDAERNDKHLAVLFIDLDHFKDVNDTMGHAAGDALIRAVADRLTDAKRKTDVVARMGGDEFAVLAVNLDRAAAATHPARRILETLSAPFEINGKVIHSGASVGVTTYPSDARNAKSLLVNADLALYRAKAGGRRTYFFFDAEMHRNVQRRSQLESDLRRAVDNGDLVAHFQPQIDIRGRRVAGAEALVRWPHAELGMVSPGAFIPIAEATGLIAPIGEQVLRQSCAACVEWGRTLGLDLRVAVNLSPNQFHADNLAEKILGIVDDCGLAPSQLEVEITEETIMRNVERAASDLQALREAGVQVGIDDFGTGYSSLAYLKRFPVDHLKIDRTFIEGVDRGRDDRAIVGSVIGLAHALGMAVVAEGVERESQLAFLQGQSCDEVQGFLFSPALENGKFQDWVRKFQHSIAAGGTVEAADHAGTMLARQEEALRP